MSTFGSYNSLKMIPIYLDIKPMPPSSDSHPQPQMRMLAEFLGHLSPFQTWVINQTYILAPNCNVISMGEGAES